MAKKRWIDEAVEGLREFTDALERGVPLEKAAARVEYVVKPPAAFPARRVKELRHRLRVSQAIFAGLLAVSPKTIQAWEREGVPNPSMRRLLELIEAKYAKPARRRRAG